MRTNSEPSGVSERVARKLRRKEKRATELQPLPGTNPVSLSPAGYELPRLEGCSLMLDCLELADRNDWPGMSCGHCQKYIEKHGTHGARRKRVVQALHVPTHKTREGRDGLEPVDGADRPEASSRRVYCAPVEKARAAVRVAKTTRQLESRATIEEGRGVSGRPFSEAPFDEEEETRALFADQVRMRLLEIRTKLDELEKLINQQPSF